MKRKGTIILIVCMILTMLSINLVFAADVSVVVTPDSADEGDEVTVSGTADPEVWVTIKVLESSGSIVYLNSILSDSDGGYSDILIIPDVYPGVLQVVIGYGSNTTTTQIKVTSSSGGTSTSKSTASYQAVVSRNDITENTLPVLVNANADSASADLGTLASNIFSDEGVTVVIMPYISSVTAYTLELPTVDESTSLGQDALTFSTDVGSITITDNMFSNISEIEKKKISIIIEQGNKSYLSDEAIEVIGDRPLVQLTLKLDGEQIEWNNPDAPVTVSIPYTPTAMELLDPEHIVILYIDGQGKAVSIPNGRYDQSTGTVTFTTTHFSYYAVAYVKKTSVI
jgi:hypothetical protein